MLNFTAEVTEAEHFRPEDTCGRARQQRSEKSPTLTFGSVCVTISHTLTSQPPPESKQVQEGPLLRASVCLPRFGVFGKMVPLLWSTVRDNFKLSNQQRSYYFQNNNFKYFEYIISIRLYIIVTKYCRPHILFPKYYN